MKKFLKWLAVPALAAGILVGSASGALAGGDVWHRGQADYYYGTNNTVDVELSGHTWQTSTGDYKAEGNMYVNTLGANDVKAIDILHIKLWLCDTNGSNCQKVAEWPNFPGTFCLATCGNPNYRKDTDNILWPAPTSQVLHVEAIYQLQWSNGNWSTTKDENSGTFTP